jgi:hypothetical protein
MRIREPQERENKMRGALVAVVILCFCARGYAAKGPYDGIGDDNIRSVLQRGDKIIAATPKGIYEADVKEKKWRKLGTPPFMSPEGMLIQQGPDSPVIGYYITCNWEPPEGHFAKFCISKDAGKTWRLTSQGMRITEFYIHPDGSLYACELTPAPDFHPAVYLDYRNRGTVLRSQDFGATWKEIKTNLPEHRSYCGLMQDPDHPGLVCVREFAWYGNGESFPVYQADDATYQWKEVTREEKAENRAKWSPFKGISRWGYFWGGKGYNIQIPATLSNFFTLPYMQSGNGLGIQAVQVETAKSVYTFRSDGPMIVPVKVVILVKQPSVKILDNKDERVFWGMNTIAGDGRVVERPAVDTEGPASAIPDVPVDLDAAHPYAREIDISKLGDFSVPGKYQIQLYHHTHPVRDDGGTFGGQVIDVTITP